MRRMMMRLISINALPSNMPSVGYETNRCIITRSAILDILDIREPLCFDRTKRSPGHIDEAGSSELYRQ